MKLLEVINHVTNNNTFSAPNKCSGTSQKEKGKKFLMWSLTLVELIFHNSFIPQTSVTPNVSDSVVMTL